MTWKIKEFRRVWATKDHDLIHVYQAMEGRVPIPELIEYFEKAGIDWRKSAVRTEKWERETLARLTAKYGAP